MYASMFYAYLQDVFLFDLSFQTLQFVGGAIIIIFSALIIIFSPIRISVSVIMIILSAFMISFSTS